jgi:hypothetical protein
MLPGDEQSTIPNDLFTDPRVTRYWDQDRTLGTWFADHGLSDQPILWDAYILFDAQTLWTDNPAPIAFGDPIIGDTDTLNDAISVYTTPPG